MTASPGPLSRPPTAVIASSQPQSFVIDTKNKSYKHQYSNIYFLRLHQLRKFVEAEAKSRWGNYDTKPKFIPRVLEVEKGTLCYIIGTVYMEMPLKPNVLEDLARDHSIPAPPPPPTFYSDDDIITLEDESGRICLVGDRIHSAGLVTGVILGALGIETANGDFQVVDYCFAGLTPQPKPQPEWPITHEEEKMDVDGDHPSDTDEWIALVSGFEVGALSPVDAQIELLVEFLTGELGGTHEQSSSSRISRLIIAGNSLAEFVTTAAEAPIETDRKSRRYGQEQSTFSPHATVTLSAYLHDIARSMPIHLLPGPSDPSGTILPQQALPRAMFGGASAFSTFTCETNPAYIHLGKPSSSKNEGKASSSKNGTVQGQRTLLVNSGQPLNDMFKYLASPPHSRLSMAESTLRWRHMAPTAPDTLWCHPFFTVDPFVITEPADFYIIGNQPQFATKMVEGDESRCRIILVPAFKETGIIVLANLRTLEVKTMSFSLDGF